MPDERRYALQLRIGAFILVSLVVFLAIVYLLGARARYFESKYDLVAEFTEVGGLIEGATVRLAGVQIGRVTSVVLPPQPGGKVRVTMTRRAPLPGSHPPKLRGAHLDPGAPGRQDRRDHDGLARGPAARPRRDARVARTLRRWAGCSPRARAPSGRSTSWCRPFAPPRTGSTRAARSTISGRRPSRLGASPTRWRRARGGSTSSSTRSPRRFGGSTRLLASTQQLIARAESGESAVGVLLSKDSGKSARALLAALDALGRAAEKPGPGDGLLPGAPVRPRVPAGRPRPPGPRQELPRRLRKARARRGPARRHAPGRAATTAWARPGPISARRSPTCAR